MIGTLNYRYVTSYAVEDDLCSTSPNNVPMPSQYPTPIYIVLLMVKLRDGSDGHFTYHVTRGGEVVVLCDEQIYAPSATPTITPTLTPTPSPTFTMTPTRTPRSMIFQTNTPRAATLTATLEHDVCLSLLPSRLTAGEQGRIAQQCP